MIIRNQVTKTLKASPLNNRGCERSEHPRIADLWVTSTLKGSPVLTGAPPIAAVGAHPSGCFYIPSLLSAGRSDLRILSGDAFSVSCTSLRIIIMQQIREICEICGRFFRTRHVASLQRVAALSKRLREALEFAPGELQGKNDSEVSPCKGKRNNRRRRLRVILLPLQGGGGAPCTQGVALGYCLLAFQAVLADTNNFAQLIAALAAVIGNKSEKSVKSVVVFFRRDT